MQIWDVIGILGAALILIAFALNQFNIWNQNDRPYDLVNMIGAGLLVAYAFEINSWPFVAINAVWFLVSLRDVVMPKRKRGFWKR